MVSQNSLNNQVLNNDFTVTHTNSGGNAFVSVANLSNTASSDATLIAQVAGASAGDAKVNLNISGGQNWTLGLDNSDSDAFVLAASSALGTTNVMRAATTGNVSVVLGDFDVTRANSGGNVSGTVSNTSNTASSNATQFITVAGASAGDAQVQYAVNGVTTWTEGIDNSDGDAYALAISNALGTTNAFHITTAGAPTFPISPLDVPSGGTTKVSFTAYSVICGGTTSTGALQNVSGVGTAGQILTSNGAGALPSWQAGGGTGTLSTLTGNTGGAISPTGGNINTLGTGSITIAGAGSTLTTQLTGLTNHNVLVGAGTATISNVAPSATSGVPLVSQGAAADPAFGTAVVAGGGTGLTSLVAYAVMAGGTTSTGNVQQVSGLGNSGQVLTSNGAGALPTWQANANLNITTVAITVFTNSGSYAKAANLQYAIVEVVGGGAGGGGNAINSTTSVSVGGGGGAGGYTKGVFAASALSASETVTIGSGGAGGPGINGGGNGGATSFGSHLSVNGGSGGGASAQITTYSVAPGGAGGSINVAGSYSIQGLGGGYGAAFAAVSGDCFFLSGAGGSSPLGAGGPPIGNNSTGNGASGYGAGGGGGTGIQTGGGTGGGSGSGGICIITQFLS